MDKQYEEICCKLIKDTGDAVLLSDGTREEWIPISLLSEYDPDWEEGSTYVFEVEEWKLKDAGFI